MGFDEAGFILSLLAFAYILIFVFSYTSHKIPEFMTKNKKAYGLSVIGAELLLIILAILDLSGVLDFGGVSLMPLIFAVSGFISGAGAFLRKKYSPERCSGLIKFAARSMMVCTLIEIMIFNMNSFHLLFGNYSPVQLDTANAVTENFDTSSSKTVQSGNASIEFKNLNMPVGTLTIESESLNNPAVTYSISFSDDTNKNGYRTGCAMAEVINSNERSQTVVCNFSGNTYDLKLDFSADDGDVITIGRIAVNIPVFIHFSFLRFFLMLLGSIGIYILVFSPAFRKSFKDNSILTKTLAYSLTGIFIILSLVITNCYRYSDPDHSLKKDFTMETGNQITQEIVDAFENGQVSLLREPEPELLALENPYDNSQRSGINYAWDHVLYDGKYYSYYGIAPVVLLFLPFHKITGYYFPSVWAIWLFGALGIFFLSKFYMSFTNKFFRNVRSSLIISGLIMMQLITGIWLCYNTPNFYEIAQSAGFACVTCGAFLLMSSNVLGDGKIIKWRVCLSSVMLGLGVLCRPTLVLYCFAAFLFIWGGLRKMRSQYTAKNSVKPSFKHYLPYLLCALVPFAVIGGVQMVYNYARFDSFFDFGIQYSLTINDFTQSQYHTHFVLVGLYNFLLAIPDFAPDMPFFIGNTVETFNPQGYYFIATYSAIGLIWKALPVLSYGYGLKAYRKSNGDYKRLYSVIILVTCIVIPFIIMCSVWESGYAARYSVDVAWQLLTGALAIAFIMFDKANGAVKSILNKLMTASLVVCFVLCAAQSYSWILTVNMPASQKASFMAFERLFEFWK
ncbi:hypothetical protein [Porcipelethomonas sp.]|uniref:hypothetical protein n=1 Tax=Porcipelethomonas sp. TaxID=2981675 RepID=UPI003EF2EB86